jgi:hypothetical protein
MNEYQVPLVEQLKSVPDHARFVQEEEFSSAYYPVGNLCHQAADRIAELEKENAFIKNNLCTPLLGPMFHGNTYEDSKALQPKPLSNEEIRTLIDEHWEKTSNVNLFEFARAVLRKAQEK